VDVSAYSTAPFNEKTEIAATSSLLRKKCKLKLSYVH
jgi:hypothetical protein